MTSARPKLVLLTLSLLGLALSGCASNVVSAGGGGAGGSSSVATGGKTSAEICGVCAPSPNGSSCYVPGDVCTDPCSYGFGCKTDAQCPTDKVCGSCGCVAKCQADAQCKEGESCDASTGHCVPIPCGGGTSCPPLSTCLSGSKTCAPAPCSADADCPGGLCYDGTCHAGAPACRACF